MGHTASLGTILKVRRPQAGKEPKDHSLKLTLDILELMMKKNKKTFAYLTIVLKLTPTLMGKF